MEVPEEELFTAYQQRGAAGKRFREAAEMRKDIERKAQELEEREKLWASNAVHAYQKANPNATRKDALEWLAKQMEPLLEQESLSPEGKALLEERQKREQLEAKMREQEEGQKKAQFEAEVQKSREALATRWKPALEKVGLPTSPLTFAAMASFERANRDSGLDLTPDELAKGTLDLLIQHQERIAEGMSGEQLLNAFPGMSHKIHKALIARWEQRRGQPSGSQPRLQPREEQPNGNPRARLLSEKELNKKMGLPNVF